MYKRLFSLSPILFPSSWPQLFSVFGELVDYGMYCQLYSEYILSKRKARTVATIWPMKATDMCSYLETSIEARPHINGVSHVVRNQKPQSLGQSYPFKVFVFWLFLKVCRKLSVYDVHVLFYVKRGKTKCIDKYHILSSIMMYRVRSHTYGYRNRSRFIATSANCISGDLL